MVKRRRHQRVIKLASVRIVGGMFELAMCAQVVAASVRGPAQGTLEPSGKVHVVVVSDVRHHFTTQFAAMQVEGAGHTLERQPHVPTLGACNTHTSHHFAPHY